MFFRTNKPKHLVMALCIATACGVLSGSTFFPYLSKVVGLAWMPVLSSVMLIVPCFVVGIVVSALLYPTAWMPAAAFGCCCLAAMISNFAFYYSVRIASPSQNVFFGVVFFGVQALPGLVIGYIAFAAESLRRRRLLANGVQINCSHCGYVLIGLRISSVEKNAGSVTCPECGKVVKVHPQVARVASDVVMADNLL